MKNMVDLVNEAGVELDESWTTVRGWRQNLADLQALVIEDFKKSHITTPPPRMVVCAANRIGDLIICGARHYDDVMRPIFKMLPDPHKHSDVEQGFVDQRGVFLTREEAWIVADAAGQIRRRVGGDDGGVLYSENLY
jgi:hypothetical protein